jgi:RNA polymerase sigma-70 factor (ECF subfamily)
MFLRRRAQCQNLKHIRLGRRKAYEALICQHYKEIYGFMVYLTGDKNRAEDLTQDTFVAAWANIDSLRAHASLKSWLHQIAYRKFIDSQRATKRSTAMLKNMIRAASDISETPNPLYQVMADEHSALLYEAIGKLEPSQYLLIILHYFQGLSFREMTTVLGRPIGTIKWQTGKALKTLKSFLSERVYK